MHKRKKLIIYPEFQYKFIGYFLSAIFISCFLLYVGQFYLIKELYHEGVSLNLPLDHEYFKILSYHEEKFKEIFFTTVVVFFIFFSIFGLILSHRIAGPLVKLNKAIKKVIEGEDPKEIQFRKNDFFKEVADNYNESIKISKTE